MSETTQTPTTEAPAGEPAAETSLLSAAAPAVASPDAAGAPPAADVAPGTAAGEPEPSGEGAQPVALTAGAPEGAYTLTPPEGVTLDADLLGAVTDDFKAANLSEAQAQKLAETAYPKVVERVTSAIQAQNEAAFAQTAKEWETEARADPDFKDWNGAMAKVAATRDLFGTPKLMEFLNATKLGSNVEVLRFFKNVGDKVSTGPIHNGGADAPAPAAARFRDLYTDMPAPVG